MKPLEEDKGELSQEPEETQGRNLSRSGLGPKASKRSMSTQRGKVMDAYKVAASEERTPNRAYGAGEKARKLKDSDDAPFYSIDKSMKSIKNPKTRPASTEKAAKSSRVKEENAKERASEKRASTSSHPTKRDAERRGGARETEEVNFSESGSEDNGEAAVAAALAVQAKKRTRR